MGSQPKDPLIQAIENNIGVVETAILWGYLGDVVGGFQTLYTDLTRERWVEIDINDIKMSRKIDETAGDATRGNTGGSLVWVIKDTMVKRVAWTPPRALDVALSFLGGGFLPPPPDHDRAALDPPGPPKSGAAYHC